MHLRFKLRIFILVVGFMTSACAHNSETETTIEKLRAALQNQVVMGSSPEEVEAILQRNGIEHSAYQDDTSRINSIVRDVEKTLDDTTSIQVEFLFEDHRLTRYTLEKAFTGL